mmetsp:Transcript_10371/g.14286  ORF Transcript_10371/g.14286 Transcript_10371/m.14286 type:complete len:336 (-) Transcript_10371:8-1015(-)
MNKSYFFFIILVHLLPIHSKEICKGNGYVNGSWILDSKLTKKSFICCQHEDVGIVPYCGDSKEENEKIYFSSEDLLIAPDKACMCDIVDGTQHNVSAREKYSWVPDHCLLEKFSGVEFCYVLGKRRLLMVGDSLMHQMATVLINILKTLHAPCLDQISYGVSSHLLYQANVNFGMSKNMHLYFNMNSGADICLVNAGAHLDDEGDLYNIWENIQPWVKEYRATYNTTFVWVTQSFGHLQCEKFQAPLKEYTPITPNEYGLDRYSWRNFVGFDRMSKDLAAIHNFGILDVSMLRLRPDAHKANRIAGHEDCLHWCLPGPLDIFPTLLYNKLSMGEI